MISYLLNCVSSLSFDNHDFGIARQQTLLEGYQNWTKYTHEDFGVIAKCKQASLTLLLSVTYQVGANYFCVSTSQSFWLFSGATHICMVAYV